MKIVRTLVPSQQRRQLAPLEPFELLNVDNSDQWRPLPSPTGVSSPGLERVSQAREKEGQPSSPSSMQSDASDWTHLLHPERCQPICGDAFLME